MRGCLDMMTNGNGRRSKMNPLEWLIGRLSTATPLLPGGTAARQYRNAAE